jgi:hypothetical protein
VERGDHKKEREKCYDIVALRSQLFPLENLLTRGLINLNIWKNKQYKKSDSKMLKICVVLHLCEEVVSFEKSQGIGKLDKRKGIFVSEEDNLIKGVRKI